jgi:hypothetical protein
MSVKFEPQLGAVPSVNPPVDLCSSAIFASVESRITRREVNRYTVELKAL